MISAQPADFDDYVVRNRRALNRFATVLSGRTWLADDLVADVLLSWRRRLARTSPRADVERPGRCRTAPRNTPSATP